MNNITITAEAHNAIRSCARSNYEETGYQHSNGDWTIPLSDETLNKLHALMFPNETYSDLMIRLAAYDKSAGGTN